MWRLQYFITMSVFEWSLNKWNKLPISHVKNSCPTLFNCALKWWLHSCHLYKVFFLSLSPSLPDVQQKCSVETIPLGFVTLVALNSLSIPKQQLISKPIDSIWRLAVQVIRLLLNQKFHITVMVGNSDIPEQGFGLTNWQTACCFYFLRYIPLPSQRNGSPISCQWFDLWLIVKGPNFLQ